MTIQVTVAKLKTETETRRMDTMRLLSPLIMVALAKFVMTIFTRFWWGPWRKASSQHALWTVAILVLSWIFPTLSSPMESRKRWLCRRVLTLDHSCPWRPHSWQAHKELKWLLLSSVLVVLAPSCSQCSVSDHLVPIEYLAVHVLTLWKYNYCNIVN